MDVLFVVWWTYFEMVSVFLKPVTFIEKPKSAYVFYDFVPVICENVLRLYGL